MICDPIAVAGIEIPCDAPFFLIILAVHIPFGIACTVTGAIAILSKKRPARHPTFGTLGGLTVQS